MSVIYLCLYLYISVCLLLKNQSGSTLRGFCHGCCSHPSPLCCSSPALLCTHTHTHLCVTHTCAAALIAPPPPAQDLQSSRSVWSCSSSQSRCQNAELPPACSSVSPVWTWWILDFSPEPDLSCSPAQVKLTLFHLSDAWCSPLPVGAASGSPSDPFQGHVMRCKFV